MRGWQIRNVIHAGESVSLLDRWEQGHLILPEAVWSEAVCHDPGFISSRFVWHRFIKYCFVWVLLVWCCLFEGILSKAASFDLQLEDASDLTIFFPVVWGCLVSVVLYDACELFVETPTQYKSVCLLSVFSLAVFYFNITQSQVFCTLNMLSIAIYLRSLAVKCTKLAT